MKDKNTTIFFMGLFLLALIVSIIGIKKMGLFDGDESNNQIETNYSQIENDLTKASKKYISEKYNNILDEEIIIVRVNTLKENDYINNIKDAENNSCSGYVEVYKNSSSNILYKPYINCENYKTEGYDSGKDW